MTSLILCKYFFYICANALIVNPCTKFCCDIAPNNEDNKGGGICPSPNLKMSKIPVRLGLKAINGFTIDDDMEVRSKSYFGLVS